MAEQAALNLLADPRVDSIEENGWGHLSSHFDCNGTYSFEFECYPDDSWWHLDRIDQRESASTHHLKAYGWTYTGDGVDIYIIDSGVRSSHNEFSSSSGSRVAIGRNFSGDTKTTTDTEPCISHGTSVASLAAGNTVGVAREATIVPIRISPCDDPQYWASINTFGAVQAVDWVIEQRLLYYRPSVVNMSFFRLDPDDDVYECEPDREGNPGSCLDAFEGQIQEAIANGITVVVSANNQDKDNCAVQTPARLGYGNETLYPASGRTITVGGTDINDEDYYCPTNICQNSDRGSNRGPCVSFYAPADLIRSASIENDQAYRDRTDQSVSSGTSFASPIVAGAAARWLDQYPSLTPAEIWYWLQLTATILGDSNSDGISDVDFDEDGISENNRLLYIDVYH